MELTPETCTLRTQKLRSESLSSYREGEFCALCGPPPGWVFHFLRRVPRVKVWWARSALRASEADFVGPCYLQKRGSKVLQFCFLW